MNKKFFKNTKFNKLNAKKNELDKKILMQLLRFS